MRQIPALLLTAVLMSCAPPADLGDIGASESTLTSAERRVRAGQIRDAAAASGITQGYLLAGIADAETRMSQCWSELTWACMGPNSADCGGGPVVAGAGDGPCSLRQGGLGMFQFDAGTFDDTLAREGDRVLSIAGNVAAAVDFVVSMVKRSTYVAGVDTDAQAIEWINSVRINNAQWDPWIRTVTHYYNGCRPSYSCFSSRYAHYRDNTTGVYDEMGAEFWGMTSGSDFAAEWVSQSFPLASATFELYPGQEMTGVFEMRNVGEAAWMPGVTLFAPTPRDVASPLASADWVAPTRASTVDRVVPPGETGMFAFTVRGPDVPGEYSQFFGLVQEGVSWFADQGGPPDNVLEIRVTVVELPACVDGTPDTWTCSGDTRARCVLGEVERETCAFGCVSMAGVAACAADPGTPEAMDLDGDGVAGDLDCDDDDPLIYPGAVELCDDDVDQNCDGFECHERDDGTRERRPIGTPLSGGCGVAVGDTPSRAAVWLMALLALVWRRRGR